MEGVTSLLWSKINHFRTNQGHCASCHKKLGLATNVSVAHVKRCSISSTDAHRPAGRWPTTASLGWRCHCSVVDVTWLIMHMITTTTQQCFWAVSPPHTFIRLDRSCYHNILSYEWIERWWWNLQGMFISPYWWPDQILEVKGQGHIRPLRWWRHLCQCWGVGSLSSSFNVGWVDLSPLFILLGATLRNNLGQVVLTYVPLSPSCITWYRPRGGDALWLGT